MDMTGEYRIPAPREAVWTALNDPDVLRACIPGCESLEKNGDEMVATVVAKIGPVKAKFAGKVRLENLDPPNGYSIVGEGQGGVAGFAKGGADVRLAEDGSDTILTYTAKAQVGGKLAQLGSRLIDGTAKMMAEQFFSAFSARVAGDNAPMTAAEAEAEADAEVAAYPDGGAVEAQERALDSLFHSAEAAEERVEAAAIKSGPSGPMVWGLIALAVVIVVILISNL
ncbi:MAG TPA: carbon monoxide dehydrogenase subunit G [Methylomirabilota bacterium]|nr:carbon monoxide dehydrogenase subunit G [Methylomirabilota bacterium]